MPEGAIYVGRPSKWGNPFTAENVRQANPHLRTEQVDLVALYDGWLISELTTKPTLLDPLRGHDLACFCRVERPCHADILLRLANA